jgi:hypothetical protein
MTSTAAGIAHQQTRYADVLARLQRELVSGRLAADGTLELPGLPGLRARTSDDMTLALADAWAVLAEILGFHSARHDEEARLDLASELRSLIELSRLVGYQPDPGLAASASLAFTIDDAGSTPEVTVPIGTAVTSVPAPGQTAVTFETIEVITARPTWNMLLPSLSQQQTFSAKPDTVLLAGTATSVSPGDGILIEVAGSPAFGTVTSVTVRPDDPPIPGTPGRPGWTTLAVSWPVLPDTPERRAGLHLKSPDAPVSVGFDPPQPAPGPLLAALSPGGTTSMDSDALQAAATNGGFATADVFAALEASRALPQSALIFRAQSGIFGGTAPALNSLPPATVTQLTGDVESAQGTFSAGSTPVWADGTLATFPNAALADGTTQVFCDTVLRTARPGPIVLREGGSWRLLKVSAVDNESVSVFAVSGRSTVLTVESSDLSAFSIRGTSVYLAGDLLPLAAVPVTAALPDDDAYSTIDLDDWVDGLTSGQRIAITGQSATHPGLAVAHVTTLKTVSHLLSPTGTTSLDLQDPLPDALLRSTVRINANVAAATHGESRSEVLGNADGQDPRPDFTLSGSPLTYLPAATGSEPALTVWVNGLERSRVPALLDPAETGYVVRQDDQQNATIEFGSPLPTGVINVRADYRVGLGAGAGVGAGRLSMLASRPPGVRAVVNPLPASGGADPETVDDARRNAPVSVRALDRVVSLVDYADFARAYPGIAKASSKAVTIGVRPGVEVTVAGAHGADVTTDSALYSGLLAALAAGGDELVPVRLLTCQRVPIQVGAALRIDTSRITADVVSAATTAVTSLLSFDARDIGQPVSSSEIVESLQSVPGVLSANVRVLLRLVGGRPEDSVTYRPLLRATVPTSSASKAGVLMTLDVAALDLEVVAP